MDRVLDLIEWKVAEADFFLSEMNHAGFNVFGFQCYLSAFLSASRSITFTLQAVMRSTDGFDDWYDAACQPLKESDLAKFFVQRRNVAMKTGDAGVTGGSMRHDDSKVRMQHWFDPEIIKALPPDLRRLDVAALAERYMALLVELVSKWEGWYYGIGPGGAHARPYKTPEELEALLGLPVGWTDGVGLTDDERLSMLLRNEPAPISFAGLRERYGLAET